MTTNYYEILEIPTDSDEREIKQAYHRLARELHPDKAPSPAEALVVEERFALVSAAYNTLKDRQKREDYDKGIKKEQQSPTGTGPRLTPASRVLQAGRNRPAAPPASPPKSVGMAAAGSAKTPPQPVSGITPERVNIAQKAYARGLQALKESNDAKAITFFEAAIQNNDQEASYHAKLGMALIREHRSATRALEHAQRAIDLDPYNMEHKFNLAFIYETIGSASNARRIYEEILRWDVDNLRAKSALAGLSKKKGPFGFGGGGSSKPASSAKPSGPGGRPPGGFLQNLLDRFKKS